MTARDRGEEEERTAAPGTGGQTELTPEELIVEIYRQRSVLVEAGRTPARVVISAEHYHRIRAYHESLGDIAPGKVDYLDRYRIFDLEICLEEIPGPRVEPG